MINQFKEKVKNFIKTHFYIFKMWDKLTPAVQIGQRQLFLYYQECYKNNKKIAISDTGFKVFSQYEEDGMLLFIFSILGMKYKNFVDIGGNDGVNSNCANFAINFGWNGLFIDSDKTSINRGKHFYKKHPDPWAYPQKFICERVTRENINSIIENAGFTGVVDMLSIDIDGDDYWIWDAINSISPNVVIIESRVEFGLNNIVVPYKLNHSKFEEHPIYNGASPVAMNELAKRKGYRLVGANNYGHNMIFVKAELEPEYIPEVSVASILKHPGTIESFKEFEEVKHLPFSSG